MLMPDIYIPGVTEVFFWNGGGDIEYGSVRDKSKLADGTVILTLRMFGHTNKIVTLPASAVTIVPPTLDYKAQAAKAPPKL